MVASRASVATGNSCLAGHHTNLLQAISAGHASEAGDVMRKRVAEVTFKLFSTAEPAQASRVPTQSAKPSSAVKAGSKAISPLAPRSGRVGVAGRCSKTWVAPRQEAAY